jgi:hypothetical protein
MLSISEFEFYIQILELDKAEIIGNNNSSVNQQGEFNNSSTGNNNQNIQNNNNNNLNNIIKINKLKYKIKI